jgi:hypothetical protein
VRTNEPEAAAAARIGARRVLRERSALLSALRPCFARTQTWQQAGKYVSALASELPSRNGRSIAEHAGDRSPDAAQRLLNRASWDEAAAIDWDKKEQVRASLRRHIRRLLAKYRYPPDKQESAVALVMQQAELFAAELVA